MSYLRQFGAAPRGLGLGKDHSGLSPLDPCHVLLPSQQVMSQKNRERIEEYQKAHFRGFTTQMLIDIDAITNRELNANDLNDPLHPLLQRSRWSILPKDKLDALPFDYIPDTGDMWSASLDSVWNVLLPSLRLVSILLKKHCEHPWFEALMVGDREPIHEDRLDPTTKLTIPQSQLQSLVAIKLMPPGPKSKSLSQEAMLFHTVLDPFLKLDFMDAKINPISKKNVGYLNGLTTALGINDLRIWLAWQDVAPLLRNDLTSSQKLAEQLAIAQTLLHELMHAYNIANDIFNQGPTWKAAKEPYFEDEPCSELGYSAENAFFGGTTDPFIRLQMPTPHLGFFHNDWPDNINILTTVLNDPPLYGWRYSAPLPASYCEMVQSSDFWSQHFRAFGIMRVATPAKVAIQDRKDTRNEWIVLSRSDSETVLRNKRSNPVAALLQLSPSERNYHDQRMKSASIEKIATLLDSRKDTVVKLVDQGEVCERYKGPPEQAKYTVEVDELLDRLEVTLVIVEECVRILKQIENGGEKQIDLRNNILAFQHNLHKFADKFSSTSDGDLNKRMSKFLLDMERASADLDLRPTVIEGYVNSAIREEDEYLQDFERAKEKFNDDDMTGCRSDCIKIMTALGASLALRSRVRLLYASNPTLTIEERQLALNRAVETMKALHQGHSSTILLDWEKEAEDVQHQIDIIRDTEGDLMLFT